MECVHPARPFVSGVRKRADSSIPGHPSALFSGGVAVSCTAAVSDVETWPRFREREGQGPGK